MPDIITSLNDVRPGDMYLGPLGGPWLGRAGVTAGEIIIGDGFQIGALTAEHIGIVTSATIGREGYGYRPPQMAQAMPGGAEVVNLEPAVHWTPKSAFIRLPEDYLGQGQDAAAVALAMVRAGVAYSPLSYVYLAAYHWGWRTQTLLDTINRRREPVWVEDPTHVREPIEWAFPREAICSVFFDDCWTATGKQVMPEGTPPQVVTPGGLAKTWWDRPGVVRGGAGVLL